MGYVVLQELLILSRNNYKVGNIWSSAWSKKDYGQTGLGKTLYRIKREEEESEKERFLFYLFLADMDLEIDISSYCPSRYM